MKGNEITSFNGFNVVHRCPYPFTDSPKDCVSSFLLNQSISSQQMSTLTLLYPLKHPNAFTKSHYFCESNTKRKNWENSKFILVIHSNTGSVSWCPSSTIKKDEMNKIGYKMKWLQSQFIVFCTNKLTREHSRLTTSCSSKNERKALRLFSIRKLSWPIYKLTGGV